MSSPQRPSRSAVTVSSPAGIYDYLIGGAHHSAADREAAQRALASAPEARPIALENRAFMQRAVRYVAQRGVRQYIDIGSGFPTAGPVHEIAADTVADPHVVYVDYDPAVITLSRELLQSPAVLTVAHDLRHPWEIIDDPDVGRLIDWSEPVAVLMVAILHFVTNSENPEEIIATFRDHMVPGSYLVLSHASQGERPDAAEEAARAWDSARSPVTLRSPSDIERLFTGFELIQPGLVTTTEWGTTEPAPTDQTLFLAGVGEVPDVEPF
jgi:O-methyltransferase involved in polyketide biosynthesis